MTNGESDFESRGFTHGYEEDYISVQCVVFCNLETSLNDLEFFAEIQVVAGRTPEPLSFLFRETDLRSVASRIHPS